MRRWGRGRYHNVGGYQYSPQVGVGGSPRINWEGLLKLLLVGAAAVGAARATAQAGQSSRAPEQRALPSQPAPAWANYAVGGAVAAPAIWRGAKSIYEWLDSVELPEPEVLPSPAPQNAPPVAPVSQTPAQATADDWGASILAEFEESLRRSLSTHNNSPAQPWSPLADSQWQSLAPHPSVGAIVGRRGGGKSALGYRLLELQRDRAACYAVGPPSLRKLLPDWIGVVQDIGDVPSNAVVLIDEAYLLLHSRDSMSRAGRSIGPMINLSRQRRLSLIFISQEARQIDVNILSQLDWLAVKEPSALAQEFERKELRKFTDKARAEFDAVRGDRRPWTWVYSEPEGFSGMVKNELASFWREALSHAFADAGPSAADNRPSLQVGLRKGQRTPKAELKAKARAMREAGYSYSQIARALGVSKGTVSNWLHEE